MASPDTRPTPGSAWSYRPSLDGLRMLAMYLIVLFHTQVPWLQGSFVAVNLFFVLSGYLVTQVVLTEMDRTGRLDLGRFYARRVRRLLPAALVAIAGICVLFLLVAPVVRRLGLVADAQSSLLYVANWRFIAQANDYFAPNVDKSPFLHFWTLSIEEQFYIFFPLLVVLLARSRRRRMLFAGLAAVTAASVAAQVYWSFADPIHAYYGTDARLYQLSSGALLAVGLRLRPVRVTPRFARATASLGVALFAVLCLTAVPLSQSVRGLVGTMACLLIVAGLMLDEQQPLGRVLSVRPVVYLGQISYSTYLWHWPAILVMGQFLTVGPVTMAVLAAALATGLAAVSGELLEHPIRVAERLNRFRWGTSLVGVACTVLVAALVVPALLERERPPAVATTAVGNPEAIRLAAATSEPVPKDVDWQAVDRDRGKEGTCAASDPESCVIHEGSGPHVLLVGDSHAGMMTAMFEGLAEEHDFTLSTNIVSGCPWQENLRNTQSSPKRQQRCDDARKGWYDEVLPKLDPDLVVVASLPRDHGKWHQRLQNRDGSDAPLERSLLHATRDTLDKIGKVATRTLMVQSVATPRSFVPNDCLTSAKDPAECVVPLATENRPTDAYYLAMAADVDAAYSVDLNPAFCPSAPLCSPVVDGMIVWRDKQHLTAGFVAHQQDRVWRIVKRTGVLDAIDGL
jgi:peptidoglycan/LPS O-acetylase OafA/YrhL